MRYNAPSGSTNPNAPYVGKSIALQRQGSKIPPQAVEYTQREIVNVIDFADVEEASNDALDQLARAIRSGMLNTFVDISTTPGTITVGSALVLASYNDGLPFVVRLNQTILGPTLLNFNGLGPRPVVHSGGGALQRGDYRKDDLVELRFNAKRQELVMLTPVSEALINTPVVKTIAGLNPDFADLHEANVWLSRRRISFTGYVDFRHAAGINNSKFVYASDIRMSHPDQARVALKGYALNGSLLGAAALKHDGNDAASRVSSTTKNLETLRGVFNTEIAFVAGARLIVTGDLDLMQDILFTSDGSGPVKTNIFQGYGADNIVLENGNQNIRRIASVGAQQCGLKTRRSSTRVGEQTFFLGNGYAGVSAGGDVLILANASMAATHNSVHGFEVGGSLGCDDFTTAQIYARGNGNTGVIGNGGAIVGSNNSISRDNVAGGVSVINGGSGNLFAFNVSGNPRGILSGQNAYMDATQVTGSATDTAFYAYNDAYIARSGSSVTAPTQASPAVGTTGGNGNAYIQ